MKKEVLLAFSELVEDRQLSKVILKRCSRFGDCLPEDGRRL